MLDLRRLDTASNIHSEPDPILLSFLWSTKNSKCKEIARIRIRIQGLPGSDPDCFFFAGSGSGFDEYGSVTLIFNIPITVIINLDVLCYNNI